MKILDIDYTTKLEFSSSINDHYFLLRCVPVSRDGQTVISRNLTITPQVPVVTSKDIFGNISYQGRIDFPHNEFAFHSTATVIVEKNNGYRDVCYPLYKYNTPLTTVSSQMKEFLYSLFKETILYDQVTSRKLNPRDFPMVTEILRENIHKEIKYVSGATNVKTTAQEAFSLKQGVCQDYAQIFCALCREIGIPSRYVAGTSMGEGSTHAWAEYFVPEEGFITTNGSTMEGKWFGVDCTRNKNIDETYVIFASGRDYLDCKVDGGIFRGAADQKMTIFVKTSEKTLSPSVHQERTNFNYEKYKEYIKNQQQQM